MLERFHLMEKICIKKTKSILSRLNAETKSKILFCLGKQKIFSLAWENNYTYTLTCGNKAKDFLLLEKTTKYFLLLGKTITETFLLAETKPEIFFCL